eukprot:SAG31_NODE_1252_length_9108_cov_24.066711_10_plen_56_part_00
MCLKWTDDLQETTPDLDDPGASEIFFTVSGQRNEPVTRTTDVDNGRASRGRAPHT